MKNKTLFLFGTGTVLLALIKFSPIVDFLFNNAPNSILTQNIELIFNVLIICPIVLFFSIVTYSMSDGVFMSWWKFSRLALPVTVICSLVVNLGFFHSDGGFLNLNDTVDQVLLSAFYLFFIVGSIIQIIRGYRQKS